MPTIVNQDSLQDLVATDDLEKILWVYNGLDCVVTTGVWDALKGQLEKPYVEQSYNFVRAMQAPALEMMMHGMRIDINERERLRNTYEKKKERFEWILNEYGKALGLAGINANSPTQLKKVFYEILGCPVQHKYDKGTKKESTDREALEKLRLYRSARPICNVVLKLRDAVKMLGVIRTGVGRDGRMRCSYNVVGTETGRWSSSENVFGEGTNLQNITDFLRRMFIADEGKKLAYVDLEQAESRLVAYLSGDEAYIEACESGDLHTTVCRMVWQNLEWTGELEHDKSKVAGQNFYRHFSYRDMAKRGGHGTNYYGSPRTMAMHLKVETKLMEEFQQLYFEAFPGIPMWHQHIAATLQTEGRMVTALQRVRQFHDRLTDDATLRQAIAFGPQSVIGEILNLGMWKVWKELYGKVRILAQIHDAILIEYDEADEQTILPQVIEKLQTPFPIKDIFGVERECLIPAGVEGVGWNWAKYDYKNGTNPDGLKGITGHDERTRQNQPQSDLLHSIIL